MLLTGQAIKKRSEESVTLFALKLCLMQICSQPQCDDKDKESKDVLELELDANPKKSPHSKANGETDTLAVIAEGEHASTQCLHAKLDQILREVHQSSERLVFVGFCVPSLHPSLLLGVCPAKIEKLFMLSR